MEDVHVAIPAFTPEVSGNVAALKLSYFALFGVWVLAVVALARVKGKEWERQREVHCARRCRALVHFHCPRLLLRCGVLLRGMFFAFV